MKKKILSLFVLSFIFVGSISNALALSIYGNITSTWASATIDDKPHSHTYGFTGYYRCVDIRGVKTTEDIDVRVGSRVMYTKAWYAPDHYESQKLSVDAFVDGRFAQLIEKNY